MCKKTKKAFTLAEVLIVLSIIGIVAAMTIPILMQKNSDLATVTAVKKAYATLTNAYQMALAENGEPISWSGLPGGTDSEPFLNTLSKYLKVSKNCGTDSGCRPDWYDFWGDNQWANFGDTGATSIASAILSDGSTITVSTVSGCSFIGSCAYIMIDVNGFKGPNRLNKDAFTFNIGFFDGMGYNIKKINPFGYSYLNGDGCTAGYQIADCTAIVLNKGDMDYLYSATKPAPPAVEEPSGS